MTKSMLFRLLSMVVNEVEKERQPKRYAPRGVKVRQFKPPKTEKSFSGEALHALIRYYSD